jgi:hypothetical protein
MAACAPPETRLSLYGKAAAANSTTPHPMPTVSMSHNPMRIDRMFDPPQAAKGCIQALPVKVTQ